MSAKKDNNGKAAKSMTEHYSLGHKTVAVAMSAVMLGFGVPAASPEAGFADTDAAAEQPAEGTAATSGANGSANGAAAGKAETSKTDSAKGTDASASSSTSKNSDAAGAAAAEKQQPATASVALTLGNASIKYQGQTIAAPTSKVTVPTKNDLKFTVAADNGYNLTKVVLKVSGKESTLTANGQGVYTVPAASVVAGASIKLVTEQQAQSAPAAAATPIEDTQNTQPPQPAASNQAQEGQQQEQGSGQGNGEAGQQGAAESGTDASEGQGSNEEGNGEEGSNGEEADADNANASDGQGNEESNESDEEQLKELGDQFIGMFASQDSEVAAYLNSGSDISGKSSVLQGNTITLTYNGTGQPQFWNGGDGLFSVWQESADHRSITLTATDNWAFNGSSKATTIYCAYVDESGVWHTAGNGAAEFTVTVSKRSFTMSQPPAVAAGQDHFWIPSIIDNETSKVINLTDAPAGSFYPFEYYRDGVKIENASQYYHDPAEFSKPGNYTVKIKPNSGWIYDFGGQSEIIVPIPDEKPSESLEITGPSTVEQFKNITLKTNATTDVTWTSSDPSIATIDSMGKVTGVKEGKVTITATTVTANGTVLTATHDVWVTKSEAKLSDAYLYFQNSPTADPDSNSASAWYPTGGCNNHELGVKVNLDNISWVDLGKTGANSYDNVANRVVSWPDDSTGSSYTLSKDNKYWGILFNAWKSQLEKEQGTTITEDDVEAIILHPYKISKNRSTGREHCHMDCKVEIKCSKAINALFYLQDAGSTGFAQYDAATYKLTDGSATVQGPKNTPAETKTVNGVTYVFMGWYTDAACTNKATFPATATDNVAYYAKYVPMDQTVQVNYYLEGTTTPVAPSKTLTGLLKGQTVTQNPIEVAGYTPVSTEAKSATAGTDREINFYYKAADVNYTVNYLWNGTDEKVADSTTGTGEFGEAVVANQPEIAGCTVVPGQAAKIEKLSADSSQNVINVYYYKNVELTANSDTKEYNGEEQEVSGFTGAPEGAQFEITVGAKGTDAGTYPATFPEGTEGTVDGSGKYIATKTTNGQLEITKSKQQVTVTIKGHTGGDKYNGQSQTVEGYDVDGLPTGISADEVKLNEGESASVSGVDAGTYPMGLSAGKFSYVGKNYENVTFEVEDGELNIAQREITLTSATDSKVYDGSALTNGGVTVSGDGFVAGEGATYTVTGSQTEAGDSDNEFTYSFNEGTKAGNYKVETKFGKLTVTPVTDEVTVVIAENGGTKPYDGTEQSVTGYTVKSISNPLYKVGDFKFTGTDADETAKGTDAGTYDMGLAAGMFENANKNFTNVKFQVEDGQLVIEKRKVTLTSASDSKVYDGSPLTKNSVEVGGDGFVKDQGASYNVTGFQTVVGSSENFFSYNLNSNTKADNYDITKSEGTLTVTSRDAKYDITVEAKSGEAFYDGTNQSVSGLVNNTFTVDGNTYTVSGLQASSTPAKNAGTYTSTVTGTPKVTDANGNDVTSEFKVETKNGTFKINPRPVTLTSATDEKVYDGTALINHDVTVGGQGFADGEGATYTVSGTQTDAGESPNAFDYVLNGNTLSSNYTIDKVEGTLKVTPVTEKVTVAITGNDGTCTYDGEEKSASGYATTISNKLYNDSCFSFTGSSEAKGTNAGSYGMGLKADQFANTSKNFENVEFVVEKDGALTIAKRPVTIVSEGKQFTYNGQPQSYPNATCEDKVFGAQTDGLTSTGSVTNVGDKATNEIQFTWKNGFSADDFDITKQEGELTVAPIADEVVVRIKGNTSSSMYDGTEKHVDGYTVDSISDELYKEADFAFNGQAHVSGINVEDSASMGLDAKQFANKNSNFSNVKFEVADGGLAITPRDVTLKSDSHTWNYTGETFTLPDVVVSGSGFVAGEATDIKATGSVKNVGDKAPNAITFTPGANFKKGNYSITKEEGTLEVVKGDINKYVTLKPQDVTATYDGQSHVAGTATATDKNGNTLTIEYSTDGETWVTDPAQITAKNVSDSKTVKVRVSSANYEGYVTGSETITINKRQVTLESETASKAYDGTALTRPNVTGAEFNKDAGTGFVSGEVTKVEATGSVTNVAEGEVENIIEYAVGEGFDEGNYSIVKNPGKLSITPTTGIDRVVKLVTASFDHVYTGTEHKLPASTAESTDGSPLVIEYSVDGTTWTTDPSTITAVNVADSKEVQVRVSSTNFSDVVTGTAKLTVVPRLVTVTSKSDSKVYDGTELTQPEVTVGANGFVKGEVENVRATGSITNVGSVTNVISYDTVEGKFIPENYNIQKTEGALTVTGQSIVPDPQDPESYKGIQISDPSDSVYDGKEHKWAPEVKAADGTALKEGADYTVSYDTDDFTDVKTITVTIAGAGNYTGTVKKTYKITPAPLEVTTPSASKEYDGTALTAAATAQNIQGLVGNETATVKATGSQTEVGSSANTYSGIEWGTAKEGNYTIASVGEGTLTVTAKKAADLTVSNLEDVTYSGTSQAQKPEVKDDNTTLVEGTDYDLSYSEDATNVGTVTVTVTGKGNYAGSIDRTYKINPAKLTVTTPSQSKTYDGTALTAEGSIEGFVNNETADFKTVGSQTEVGSSQNGYAINWTGTAKQGNYTIEEHLGTLTVSESQQEIVATAVGGAYTYDGQSHGATVQVSNLPQGYSVKTALSDATATDVTEGDGVTANVDSLVIVNAAGEDVTSKLKVTTVPGTIKVNPATLTVTTPSVSKAYDGTALTAEGKISGFVNGEEATFTTTGSQTTVGKSENGYTIEWNGTAKQSNYTIEESLGTLEVTQSQAAIVVVPQGATKVYDGTPLASAGAVTYGLPSGFTLEATVNDTQTDAGSKVVGVSSYLIKNAAGEDVTSQFGNVSTGYANLTVTKRPVTLTSQGGTWTYDGAEHKNESVVASTGENEGFVEGQGFNYSNFAAITAVGTVANTFEYQPKSGTNADNYEVKVANQNLVVTAKSIEDEEHGMSVDSPNDATYDGQQHKWAPVVKDGNKTLVAGADYTVSYNKDDFTNVTGTIEVTITGTGNYSGTVVRTYQITPAEVKLQSNTRTFDYNGTYQSDSEVTVSGADALFKSQVEGLQATGKVKDVAEGQVPNTISYTWKEGFSADNYTIETVTGMLSVKAKDISTAADMSVNDPSDSVYDGQQHKWAPTVKDGNKVLSEGTDYTVSYGSDDFTNVTGAIKVTITGMDNYAGTVTKSYQITPRTLTATTPSATKVYDGMPLTAAATEQNLAGLVQGETATVKATGSQTEVGSTKNTFGGIEWGTAKESNYTVSVGELGALKVTEQSIDPNDPASYDGVQVSYPQDETYNGQEHKWAPVVTDRNGKVLTEGADYTVSYDKSDFTNVTGPIMVTITGTGNYSGSVTRTYQINPAEYHVVTDSATKTYDGTALTAPGRVVGLVGSEQVTFATTGSQTDAGSSSNGYTIAFDKSAKEGNYTHGTDRIGTLTVNKAQAEGSITLSTADATKTYDGTPLAAAEATASDAHGNAMKVEYSLDGQNWTEDASSITATDVADSATVQVRASSEANYEGYVYGTAKLTVNKRSMKLTGASDSKVYDGTALTNNGVIVEGDGFVNGEVSGIAATGSIVSVGTEQNPVTYVPGAAFKEGNYSIETVPGMLTVTAQSIVPNPQDPESYKGVTINDPADSVYDGQQHKWVPEVKAADGTLLAEGTDYTVSYDTDNFTDVKVIKVTITGIGNYSGTVTKSYQITPAKVSIETESAEKVYDGTPLTAPGSINGIVEGETVGFTVTGSQTAVGSSENGYTLAWNGTAKASNYTIESVKVGQLTVKESEDQVVVTTTGGTYTYDGQPHGATVQVGTLPAGYSVRTAQSSATATNVAEGTVAATADNLVIVNAEGEDVTSRLNIVKVDGSIQIVPAALTITTGSASKTYDGTPLTNAEMQIEGLVNGEQVVARTTGSQTEVGSSANTYEIAWGNVDASNYEVSEALGTLAVTAAPIPATPDNGGNGGNGGANAITPGAAGNPVLNNVARILANGYTAATGEATVAAPEEQIFDEENPLGTTYEEVCWVHFYIILGMILSGIYGLGVMFRRLNHIRRLRNDMNDVMGNGSGTDADKEKEPLSITNPAGMEA